MFKIGDKIIKCNKVYIIFKIKKDKAADKKETIIHFKPFYISDCNKTLTLSIPLSQIDKTDIRLPISRKELISLFTELSKSLDAETVIDISSAKDALRLNEPYKTVEVLRRLWLEKSDKSGSFTPSKEEIFKLALNQLIEEVACVSKCTLEIAKTRIEKAFNGR